MIDVTRNYLSLGTTESIKGPVLIMNTFYNHLGPA